MEECRSKAKLVEADQVVVHRWGVLVGCPWPELVCELWGICE